MKRLSNIRLSNIRLSNKEKCLVIEMLKGDLKRIGNV